MAASALRKTPLTTLEFVRRTAGMSQPELAERSGVSVATILATERFGRVPHLATARRLARALDPDVDELFPDMEDHNDRRQADHVGAGDPCHAGAGDPCREGRRARCQQAAQGAATGPARTAAASSR
jgi:DNA-binding XRE family transcriptional regulator